MQGNLYTEEEDGTERAVVCLATLLLRDYYSDSFTLDHMPSQFLQLQKLPPV